MKKIFIALMVSAAMLLTSGPARAVDLDRLDKVSVLMSRPEVIALLGEPDHDVDIILGLNSEVYEVEGSGPLVGIGCIYDEDQLVGQAYVFKGASATAAMERLKGHGFIHYATTDGVTRLLGRDDDTGAPLVVVILEEGGWTKVITFEKGFYERALKKKSSD